MFCIMAHWAHRDAVICNQCLCNTEITKALSMWSVLMIKLVGSLSIYPYIRGNWVSSVPLGLWFSEVADFFPGSAMYLPSRISPLSSVSSCVLEIISHFLKPLPKRDLNIYWQQAKFLALELFLSWLLAKTLLPHHSIQARSGKLLSNVTSQAGFFFSGFWHRHCCCGERHCWDNDDLWLWWSQLRDWAYCW